MTFLSPGRLWLLLAVATLAVVYVVMQRRRSKYAVRFTNLALLDKVAPTQPGWRRHLPAAAFLAMLGLLVVAFARPTDNVRVPRERATVIVTLDVSASMLATDVEPDRITVAREAAEAFVDKLPAQFNVGLVAFSRAASVVVPPTTDRDVLTRGINSLNTGPGTAIGDGITTSLQALAALDAQAPTHRPRGSFSSPMGRTQRAAAPKSQRRPPPRPKFPCTPSRTAPTTVSSRSTARSSPSPRTHRPYRRLPTRRAAAPMRRHRARNCGRFTRISAVQSAIAW
jgi:von Willebrand factor type A domain/Aerotolerance regulator N-terminal